MNPITPGSGAAGAIRQQRELNQMNQQNFKDEAELQKASEAFEALFVKQMLKQMRDASVESELLPKKEGEKMFRSMLDEQYSNMAAASGELGLAKSIYDQLRPHLPESSKNSGR